MEEMFIKDPNHVTLKTGVMATENYYTNNK